MISEKVGSAANGRLSEPIQWLLSLLFHSFIAMVLSVLIGFGPEAMMSRFYLNTGVEPFSPAIATTALLMGYFLSKHIAARAMTVTWIVGLIWMGYGFFSTASEWDPGWSMEPTRWSYAFANLFGSTIRCSGSECLGELLFTTPFAASVTYSLGAWLRKLDT